MGWQEALQAMVPANAERMGYNNEVDAQLKQAQAQRLIEEVMRSQAMLPHDIASKKAYEEQVRLQGLPKQPTLAEQIKAGHETGLNNRASVQAMTEAGQLEDALSLIESTNPQLAASLRKSPDPNKGISAWLRATGEQDKSVSGVIRGNTAADASRNVAEVGYHGKVASEQIRANAKIRAQEIAASAARSGKPVSMSQAYGTAVQQQLDAGEITQGQAYDLLKLGMANEPKAGGMTIGTMPDGRVGMVPVPPTTRPSSVLSPEQQMQNKLYPNSRANKPVTDMSKY